MGRPSLRRRKFFIKKEFQGKFIAFYTISIVVLSGLTTLALNSWLHQVVDDQLYSSHMKIHRTGELFLEPLIKTNLYALATLALLVLFCSIIIFKRLNRHFLRMDLAFHAMAEGDYESYTPPESHFDEINDMVELVKKAQYEYRGLTQELRDLTGEIDQCVKEGCSAGQIRSLHDRLQDAIHRVQLPAAS